MTDSEQNGQSSQPVDGTVSVGEVGAILGQEGEGIESSYPISNEGYDWEGDEAEDADEVPVAVGEIASQLGSESEAVIATSSEYSDPESEATEPEEETLADPALADIASTVGEEEEAVMELSEPIIIDVVEVSDETDNAIPAVVTVAAGVETENPSVDLEMLPDEKPISAAAVASATPVISSTPPPQSTASPAAATTAAAAPPDDLDLSNERSGALGCLRDLLLVGISTLLGAGLALLLLLAINGTLRFDQLESMVRVRSSIDTLGQDIELIGTTQETANTEISQLGERLAETFSQVQTIEKEVQTFSGQLSTIDQSVQNLRGNVESAADSVASVEGQVLLLSQQDEELQTQMSALSGQVAEISGSAEQFGSFVTGLQELLLIISSPSPIDTNQPLTRTETLTEKEPLSDSDSTQTPESPTETDETPTGEMPEPLSDSTAITSTSPVTMTEPLSSTAAMTDTEAMTSTMATGTMVTETFTSPTFSHFPPAERMEKPEEGSSHILGLVWDDLNRNGLPDQDEIPLGSITVILLNGRGQELASAVTDASGWYLFPNLDPGIYIVREIDPDGVRSITPNMITITTIADGSVEINFADAQ